MLEEKYTHLRHGRVSLTPTVYWVCCTLDNWLSVHLSVRPSFSLSVPVLSFFNDDRRNGFCSMKQLRVLLLRVFLRYTLITGYPQHFVRLPPTIRRYPFILLAGGEGHCESKMSYPRTQHSDSDRPESNALTIRPLHHTLSAHML